MPDSCKRVKDFFVFLFKKQHTIHTEIKELVKLNNYYFCNGDITKEMSATSFFDFTPLFLRKTAIIYLLRKYKNIEEKSFKCIVTLLTYKKRRISIIYIM